MKYLILVMALTAVMNVNAYYDYKGDECYTYNCMDSNNYIHDSNMIRVRKEMERMSERQAESERQYHKDEYNRMLDSIERTQDMLNNSYKTFRRY